MEDVNDGWRNHLAAGLVFHGHAVRPTDGWLGRAVVVGESRGPVHLVVFW